MAKFTIKKPAELKKALPGVDATMKGGLVSGKTIITDDAAWCKELRKLPKATVEEVLPKATVEEVPEPAEPTG